MRGDGEIIMKIWDLKECRVKVNLPTVIQQGRLRTLLLITPIGGLPNPIRQVVPLIPYIHLYPQYYSHLSPPCLSFSSTAQPWSQYTISRHLSLSLHGMIMCWHPVQHIMSTASTEYRIHRVQHTQSTVSPQDCLSSFHSRDWELTPTYWFRFLCTSPHDWPPSASSPGELTGKVTLSHYQFC